MRAQESHLAWLVKFFSWRFFFCFENSVLKKGQEKSLQKGKTLRRRLRVKGVVGIYFPERLWSVQSGKVFWLGSAVVEPNP